MSNVLFLDKSLACTGDLRRRAEDRLKKYLSMEKASTHHDIGRELYELRIDQIEIELLNAEFNQLSKKICGMGHASQGRASERGYLFIDHAGRVYEALFAGTRLEYAAECNNSLNILTNFVFSGERVQFQKFLHEVFQSNEIKTCEVQFEQALSKKRLGLELPKYALIDAMVDDEKQFCIVVIEDISERKIAEEREKESKAALSILEQTIAASRNEIFMFDVHSLHFTFANQRALENLGYTLDELKWLTPADIQSHVFNQEMSEWIADLKKHKSSIKKFNAIHLRKNGSPYPVEIYLQLFEHDSNSSFIAIVLDISSQRAIESQLKSIVESAGAIIWAADADLKLVYVSDQIFDILGYRASHFVEQSLPDLLKLRVFDESDRKLLLNGFDRVIRGEGKVSDLCYRAKHADGTWRWLSVNMTLNHPVEGHAGQIVGVMHDIHAQKLAEEALLQLNHELDSRVNEEIKKNREKDLLLQEQSRLAGMGEMIGNIAHQWRQPINSLGLILSDLEDASLYGECDLSYIQSSVGKSQKIIQRMSSTIDDFRHFFRPDKNLESFSLKRITDECLNLIEAGMKSSNINVVVNCEQDVIVNGYANEYSQALMNILSNARDAIVSRNISSREIVIDIREEGEFGVHSVTDNGGGIPPDVLPRIFEPHFTTKEHGVGIGLYMTLVTVEKNMKGRVAVENVEDGAKFSLYLRRAEAGGEHAIH